MPAKVTEVYAALEVALLVAVYFGLPEGGVGFGEDEISASRVSMPEAAVDEDGGAVFWQNYVGRTGKSFYVEPVAETTGKEVFAHNELRFGIPAPNALHAFVSLLWIQFVCHMVKIASFK